MNKKMLFVLLFFVILFLSFYDEHKVLASSEVQNNNYQTFDLPPNWYKDGILLEKSNSFKIFIDLRQVYCVLTLENNIIGYFFENVISSSDFRKIIYFGMKRVIENDYILEIQIESLVTGELKNYKSANFGYDFEFENAIKLFDNSDKGSEFLSKSYSFNKNINQLEKSEISPCYEFNNIDYGNTDTYIDGYSFITPYIEPISYEENDEILNIIPENYFFSTGVKTFQGTEYGIYKETFYETHPYYNIGRYVTSVYAYDIEIAYAGLHGDKDNVTRNNFKYSIKPLFSGMYYGYVKTNVNAWNGLGLNSEKGKMVVPCFAYKQTYYLNVNNLNIYNECDKGTYGFSNINFNFNFQTTISSKKTEITLFISDILDSILELLPGSNITTKLLDYATTLYEKSQPSSVEKYTKTQQELNKYNYDYQLDNLGNPRFVSIPFTHNYNNEFLKYNISFAKYSYDYDFRQSDYLYDPNESENCFNHSNLYISSVFSIYKKENNLLNHVSTISSSNDYGVQGIKFPIKAQSFTDSYEQEETINEAGKFQSIILRPSISGYYSIELSSPNKSYERKKATLYNNAGNVIAKTEDSISGINKMIVYLNTTLSDESKNFGKFYLRFSFEGAVTGTIKVKISRLQTINSLNANVNHTFSAQDKIQYVIFKPNTTKEYTISTTSDMDPSIAVYKSTTSGYYKTYHPFAYDSSLFSIPIFHQDDGYDYDPEEMYPNLNCYFKMKLYKENTYIFKIKNNDVINFGQLSLSIK